VARIPAAALRLLTPDEDTMETLAPQMDSLKARLKGTWSAGDFGRLLWGDEAKVRERFGTQVTQLSAQPRTIAFHFEEFAPPEVVEFWREDYGPTQRAFEALAADAQKQATLRLTLVQLWTQHNNARDGGTVVESEYLEVIAVRA
jgi:hypothetical protein